MNHMNDKIKNKTMVLGTGFLASAFHRNGFNVYGRNYTNSVESMMKNHPYYLTSTPEWKDCDYVINCIGQSDTRFCEDPFNWKDVLSVNGLFPEYLSKACKSTGKKFIHISTGCLYENTNGTKKEYDMLETHCNYTVSKQVGELNCNLDDIIIRPRLLFDIVHSNKNLLTKLEKFDTFLNEFNTISSNQTIVDSVLALIRNSCTGVYNVGNLGAYTIYQMAEAYGIEPAMFIQQSELIEKQGIYLVNNVMDMSKLIEDTDYVPNDALVEIRNCKQWLK